MKFLVKLQQLLFQNMGVSNSECGMGELSTFHPYLHFISSGAINNILYLTTTSATVFKIIFTN